MKKFILLFFISQFIWAQDFQIVEAEYFWGQTDPGLGNGAALNAADGTFDTAIEEIITTYSSNQTSYEPTLFNIRVKDADGLWGATFKKVIFVGDAGYTSQDLNITEFEYFFGNFDPGEGSGTRIVAFDGKLDNAVEAVFRNQTTWEVTSGPILFNIRAKDGDGLWGPLFKKTVFPNGANSEAQLIAEGESLEVCPGSSVTLTYNGPYGYTPTWFDGSQEETITFTPTEEGSYSCTASLDGVTYSDSIDITFKPEPEATIEPAGTVLICASSSFRLQANTGTGLSYQWFLDGNVINNATNSSYLPTALGSYTVEVTDSTTECSKLSEPTFLSNSLAIEPAGVIDFCSEQELTVPYGSTNTYQWQRNSVDIPNANSNTYIASESGNYTCIINNQTCTYETNIVELNNQSPAPTGDSIQSFCDAPTVSELSATGENIQWYDNASSGNLIGANTSLNDGQVVYASQTVNGCESNDRLAVTVSVQSTVAPTGDNIQSFCDAPTVSELSATGENIQWYDSATGGNLIGANTSLNDGQVVYASQTVNGCESNDRLDVTISVQSIVAPTGDRTQYFCDAPTVSELSATGENIQWYDNASGGNLIGSNTILADGQVVYALQTVSGCESNDRLAVTVSIEDSEAPVVNALQEIELDLVEGVASLTTDMIDLGSTDNCGITAQDLSQNTFACNDLELTQPIIVTYTVQDSSGNSTSVDVSVTLTDSQSSCENLGISETKNVEISVYPIPAQDVVNIVVDGIVEINQISIFDIRGRLVKEVESSSSFEKIDVRDLQAASYFVRMRSKTNQVFVKQIIIKK